MKTALIMNDNSYVGREFLRELKARDIFVDVIKIGSYPEINESEEERCGNHWHPPMLEEVSEASRVHSFLSLKSEELRCFLDKQEYDLGIQGGTGILQAELIEKFRLGILNFHPGDLPEYRGCSAPEWQLLEGRSVICTCHLVDAGIDTGKIYQKRKLFDSDVKDYHWMRSQVYPRIAVFLADILPDISDDLTSVCLEQDEAKAVYRNYVGDDRILELTERMKTEKSDS